MIGVLPSKYIKSNDFVVYGIGVITFGWITIYYVINDIW